MGRKVLTTCDVNQSPECVESIPTEDPPPSWAIWEHPEDADRHICPECVAYCRDLLFADRAISKGRYLDVGHDVIPEHPDLESVNIKAGTHGINVMPFIDEPPESFPEYDPPLGPDVEPEAWGIHVFDHLHIYLIGSHKDEPRVIVDSDEFPTRLEVRDSEDSFVNISQDA